MEKLFTERQAIKEQIKWIREEQRRLAGEYWTAIERLRVLDKELEQQTDGSAELVNKLIDMLAQQDETVRMLKGLVPEIPVQTIIEKHMQTTEVTTVTSSNKIDQTLIEQEKIKAEKAAPVKRRGKLDIKSLAPAVASFLKEREEVRLIEIVEWLEEKHVTLSNPSNTMNHIIKYNSHVIRSGQGKYKYVRE